MTLASVLSHPVEQLLPLVPGTLSHILTECVDLAPARQRVFNMWADYIRDKPFLLPIIRKYTVLRVSAAKVQRISTSCDKHFFQKISTFFAPK